MCKTVELYNKCIIVFYVWTRGYVWLNKVNKSLFLAPKPTWPLVGLTSRTFSFCTLYILVYLLLYTIVCILCDVFVNKYYSLFVLTTCLSRFNHVFIMCLTTCLSRFT